MLRDILNHLQRSKDAQRNGNPEREEWKKRTNQLYYYNVANINQSKKLFASQLYVIEKSSH